MATVLVSPRKPLQSLVANVYGTPTKVARNASPFKGKSLTVAPALSITLAPQSRKRVHEEMASDDSQGSLPLPAQPRPSQLITGTSFSSLIDYNARRDSSLTQEGSDTSVKEVCFDFGRVFVGRD
jgi:hypothetical protein